MILICQNIISALWDVEKMVFDYKNSDMFCYKKLKKKIFWWQKFKSVLLYIFKKIF